jgi:HK97 family phage major capsid protein
MAGGTDVMTEAERVALAQGRDRAAMAEGATTTGGFMVPIFIDPTIILTNTGMVNPFRSIATVKTIATQSWKGVTSAGVTAEWTAEAAEMTDASPTVAQPVITPVRADAYVQASWEMLEDTSIATELAMLFADARDRLEGTSFAVGTGSTQPTGVVTALQLVTASRVDATTNGAFGAIDVFALDNALPPRWRSNASWVANKAYLNRIRQMATGSGPQFAFWVDFGGGMPPSLIGYPVYETSAMQAALSTATASNDDVVILGDFRAGYYIVDRIGLSVLSTAGLGVMGANRRPTGETGFAAFWRVGGKTVIDDAFRMLRL